MKKLAGLVVVVGLGLAALTTSTSAGGKSKAPSLDAIKRLAGDWVEVGKDGKPTNNVLSSIRVTAAGSAVQEILFPGTPHEMVTMYHHDGPDVVLTHYCILGNQPRLKVEFGKDANQLVFKFIGGTNLKPEKDAHMSGGVLTLVNDNELRSEWTKCEKGKVCDTFSFHLMRKKK